MSTSGESPGAEERLSPAAGEGDSVQASGPSEGGLLARTAFSVALRTRLHRFRWPLSAVALVGIGCGAIATYFLSTSGGGEAVQIQAEDHAVLLREKIEEVKEGKKDELVIADFPVTLADLEPLRGMAGVRRVILDHEDVAEDVLEIIARLPDVQQIRIRSTQITDRALGHLEEAKNLLSLNLPNGKITSAGIQSLLDGPRLRHLRIGGIEDVDPSELLAQLTSLRALHLIGVPVTDEGLKLLAAMPQLESLYLDDSKVTDAGWDWLFANHPELHVHIDQGHHDRDPQRHSHGAADAKQDGF